jgi:hypothetical protein
MGRRDRAVAAELTPELLRVQAKQKRGEATRVRVTGEWLGWALWVVAALALGFTMSNVTSFAVDHHTSRTIAWLLDPMASLALLVVLIGDSVLSRNGRSAGFWPMALKWVAGASTWSMNVWQSAQGRDAGGIVLHSIPPALVILMAEVTPVYRKLFADLVVDLEVEAAALHARADQLAGPGDPDQAADTPPEPAVPARSSQDRAEADRSVAEQAPADRTGGPADHGEGGPVEEWPGPVDRSAGGPVVRLVTDRSSDRPVDRSGGPVTYRSTAVVRSAGGPADRAPDRGERPVGEDRTTALLPQAREIAAAHLADVGRPIGRRPLAAALRDAGQSCSSDTAAALLELLGEMPRQEETPSQKETASA